MRFGSGKACFSLIILLILSAGGVRSALAEDKVLKGLVVDARGEGVAGTTLFVTQLGRARGAPEWRAGWSATTQGADPVDWVVKSARDGTFAVLLPLGRYRIAAFKTGYGVALAEVNLQARNQVEVRMTGAGGSTDGQPEADGREGGLDWILRRSDRDALRDREAEVPVPRDAPVLVSQGGGAGYRRPSSAVRLPSIDGEFTQGMSGSSLLGGVASGPGDASGRSTRLALRGAAGAHGTWRFDGLDGRTSAALDSAEDARAGRTTRGLGAGFDYRLGAGDDLKSEVHYATTRYSLESDAAAGALDQEQTSAALRTLWGRRLGDAATMYVEAAYLEAMIGGPTEPPTGSDGGERMDRSVGTVAGVALQAEDHALDFGFRIHSYRYELGDGGAFLAGADGGPIQPEDGRRGSAVSLFGGDDWRVADRYVVNYGLAYHDDLMSGGAYVVPRVGLTTTLPEAGDLKVRSALMYRFDGGRRGSPAVASPLEGWAPDHEGARLGYEIEVERRPEDRLQFAATLSYRPFQEASERAPDRMPPVALFEEGVLILADAAAERREMGFEVQRGFGCVRGILVGTVGRVQGRMSPVFGEGPVVEMQAGQARYYMTALRAEVRPTETEVRVDFRRVMGQTEAAVSVEGSPVDYRRFDLAVLQGLPFSPIASARWRVLMAYQGLLYDAPEGAPTLAGSLASSRVTGGVDISF